MPQSWESYLDANEQAYLDELIEFLRIPSISTDPEHKDFRKRLNFGM